MSKPAAVVGKDKVINVFSDSECNGDEDEEDAEVRLDDIISEEGKSDSKIVRRCKKCKRLTFGHKGPVGEKRCTLDEITDPVELKKDDELKNLKRKEIRDLEKEEPTKAQETIEKQEDADKEKKIQSLEEELKKLKKEKEPVTKDSEEKRRSPSRSRGTKHSNRERSKTRGKRSRDSSRRNQPRRSRSRGRSDRSFRRRSKSFSH